jgi:hypothetical protein
LSKIKVGGLCSANKSISFATRITSQYDLHIEMKAQDEKMSPLRPLERAMSLSLPVVMAESGEASDREEAENFTVAANVFLVEEGSDLVISEGSNVQSRDDDSDDDYAQRPSLIGVCCFKKSHDDSLGISFHSVDGVLQIKDISRDNALAESSLRPGDHLMAIDTHRDCSQWTTNDALKYLKDLQGHFSMLFSDPSGDPDLREAVVCKTHMDDEIGVTFFNDHQNRLCIQKLTDTGLIGRYDLCVLKEGDYVHTINGDISHYTEKNVAEMTVRSTPAIVSLSAKSTNAAEILFRRVNNRSISSFISSLTVDATATESSSLLLDSSVTGTKDISDSILRPSPLLYDTYVEQEGILPRFVYVCCDKPSLDTSLGLTFNTLNGKLQISNITSYGLLWSSPLRGGYEVLAIDGKLCNTWSSIEIMEHLSSRQFRISILARNPAGSCNYVVAQVSKTTPRAKIGVTLRKVADGTLQIGAIFPSSLFAGSILNDGCEVLTINGVLSCNLSSSEAAAILEHATHTVTILAKNNPSSGIVLATLSAEEAPMMTDESRIRDHGEIEEKKYNVWACAVIVFSLVVFNFVVVAVGKSFETMLFFKGGRHK